MPPIIHRHVGTIPRLRTADSQDLLQRTASILLAIFMCWPSLGLYASEDADLQAGQNFFANQVLPILRDRCFECHSHETGESSGGLMLDSLAAMVAGGSRGSVLSEDDPTGSLLLAAIAYEDADLQMPPDEKLSDTEIQAIQRWIGSGSRVPDSFRGQVPSEDQASSDKAARHWAYQPPRRYEAGPAKFQQRTLRAATVLDAILLSKLDEVQLSFSPRADRRTLIRRLSYDLTGLPPSLDSVRRFVNDPRPDRIAYEALVARLMTSPHFGERFARYWMDVARYADNKGYVFREDREFAEGYRYRDWLITSFNTDLPYDQFVACQLAADLLGTEGAEANLPALGFITLGRRFINNKLDIIDDRLDVVSRGLMGMTLTCARCHDHKYDPITQADYYSLAGVFLNTEEPGGEPWPHRLQDREKTRDAYVLYRGSPSNRGPKVDRKFVSFLAPDAEPFSSTGSGRDELAAEIVSPDNPLTARVLANRIWMRLTGASLVDTPSDFGLRCPPPVQLELLDQLALILIDKHWSIKSLVREVVLSEFYMQQSVDRPDASAVDPENSLYWRMNRRRLDWEAFRDTLLACTHSLDLRIHGQPEKIHEPPFSTRRSIYAYIDRQNLPSVFRTFDMASPDTHSPRRPETSVPQQGLYLLNSDFVMQCAERFAAELKEQSSRRETAEVIEDAFKSILRRMPSPEEVDLLSQFLAQASASEAEGETMAAKESESAVNGEQQEELSLSAWGQLVQILLATNELAFVD